ncbi:hypothetical protein C8F04DRAFT_1190879 [Mycena alexandri]|uniref:Uncharacterized protein n=1 Tax=Mycena alexandri TaxID=1745969 RepID=A0AAD6SFG4_9AGAR|nr:hypothetical protein C8F04DRAFT_1190879 [Mycena alexandri]
MSLVVDKLRTNPPRVQRVAQQCSQTRGPLTGVGDIIKCTAKREDVGRHLPAYPNRGGDTYCGTITNLNKELEKYARTHRQHAEVHAAVLHLKEIQQESCMPFRCNATNIQTAMDNFYDKPAAANTLEREARERRHLAAANYSATFQHLANLEHWAWIDHLAHYYLPGRPQSSQSWDHPSSVVLFGSRSSQTRRERINGGKDGAQTGNQIGPTSRNFGAKHRDFRRGPGETGKCARQICPTILRPGRPKDKPAERTVWTQSPVQQPHIYHVFRSSHRAEHRIRSRRGSLEKFVTKDLFHGPDNIVKYFRRGKELKHGKSRFNGGFPGSFKVGDLVEVQALLVTIKTLDSGVKLTCRLHALMMLDNTFTKAAASKRTASKKPPAPAALIRCRVGNPTTDLQSNKKAKTDHDREDKEMDQM